MIFNTVFALWALQFVTNLVFLQKQENLRYKAGCFIWVALFFLHLFNAAFFSSWLAEQLASKDEIVTAEWAQSPGLDNPFILFFAGILGSIVLQIFFNLGNKRNSDDLNMPDTYGTKEGEENLKFPGTK
jgi:hypothetical protein